MDKTRCTFRELGENKNDALRNKVADKWRVKLTLVQKVITE
jgi:hypothetical protein